MKVAKTRRSKSFKLPRTVVLVAILAVVAIVGIGLNLPTWLGSKSAKNSSPATQAPAAGHGPNTAVNAGPGHDNTPAAGATATPTPVANPSHPATSTLAAPTETFSLDGGTISLASCTSDKACLDSTCNSVAGASCYIEAVSGAQTVKVTDSKVIAGANSGVDLPWTPTGKLTAGSWSIRAVASYNGSTATSDPEQLTVTH